MVVTDLATDLDAELAALLPREYVRYARVAAEALRYFLARLPGARLEEILREQRRLPANAGFELRLPALLECCPTLHKLGQVVARDRRLPPLLRERLAALESMAPSTPLAEVLAVIEEDLGDLRGFEIRPARHALAEASVAVVVPFLWRPRGGGAWEEGVFKVLKPRIEERLSTELAIWGEVGSFLDERCSVYDLPPIRYAETFDTIRRLLLNEVALRGEQNHLQWAADLFEEDLDVHVPSLLPFSSDRITAMERIRGRKVTDVVSLSIEERRDLAAAIVDAILGQPLWSHANGAWFHADPHAGNLFFTDEGKLAILDWSLVGNLAKHEREGLMQVALGALTLDPARVARAVRAMAVSMEAPAMVRVKVEKALEPLTLTAPPGIRWLMRLFDELTTTAGVRFGEDLLLYRKSFFTVEGVVADVFGRECVESALQASAFRQLCRECGDRFTAWPDSREFGSHLSNADLLWAAFCLPVTTLTLGLREWRKLASA